MEDDVDALVEQWIIAFCEAPVLVDAGLMRAVLADLEASQRLMVAERGDNPEYPPRGTTGEARRPGGAANGGE